MVEISIPSVYTDKNNQVLRLRASDVAAIAGYNSHANQCDLFHEYLYQDLGDLLKLDSQNVGMVVIEKKEEIDNIINLLPSADAANLKVLLKKSHDRSVKSDSNESCKLIEKVMKLLDTERVKTAVPKTSLNLLQVELVGDVRKSYGTTCEKSAIERYEEHTGHSVDSRNNMLLVWPLLSTHFSSSDGCKDKNNDKEGGGESALPLYISSHFPEGSIGFANSKVEVDCYNSLRSVPLSASSVRCIAGHACAASLIDLTGADLVAADSEDGIAQRSDGREHRRVNCQQHHANKESPIFKIVGKVDGISKHIDASSSDPTHWHEYRVVVEIKNRMNKIHAMPPLYDQIQLVTYMLMLGTTCGDLVQVVTRGDQSKAKGCYEDGFPPPAPPLAQSSSTASHSSHHISDDLPPSPSSLSSISPMAAPALKKPRLDMVQVLDFSVCRVLLNAPPYNHKDNFFSKVMPRLKVFSDAIASLRADDSQRYRWLLGSMEEKRDLLYSLCPYMKDAAVS